MPSSLHKEQYQLDVSTRGDWPAVLLYDASVARFSLRREHAMHGMSDLERMVHNHAIEGLVLKLV